MVVWWRPFAPPGARLGVRLSYRIPASGEAIRGLRSRGGGEGLLQWQALLPGDSGSGGRRFFVAAREPDGSITPSQSFSARSDPVTFRMPGVSWAFDARGYGYLAWNDLGVVYVAVRPSHGSFGPPVAISGSRSAGQTIGVDGAGNATIAWASSTGPVQTVGERTVVQTRTLGASGLLGETQTLAEGRFVRRKASDGDDVSFETVSSPQIVVSDGGQATLGWESRDPGTAASTVVIARAAPSQSISSRASLSHCLSPALLGDPAGDVAVTCNALTLVVRRAGASDFGAPEAVRTSSGERLAIEGDVMGRDGTIAVSGTGGGDIVTYTLTAIRPPGGGFASVRPLEAHSGVYPGLAFEPDGRLSAAFTAFPPTGSFADPALRTSTFASSYRAPPLVSADILNDTLADTRKRGVDVTLSVPERESLKVSVTIEARVARELGLGRHKRTIARRRLAVRGFHDREIHLPLTRPARRALRRRRRLHISLNVVSTTPDHRHAIRRLPALLSDHNELAGIQTGPDR